MVKNVPFNPLRIFLSWRGTIARGPYALAGTILFFVKWNLDRLLGAGLFDDPWPVRYIFPRRGILELAEDGRQIVAILGAISLPFIYIGIVLTLKRLRSVGLPLWLVLLFFVPFINLLFFILLSTLPGRADETSWENSRKTSFLDNYIPKNRIACSALAVVLWAGPALLGIYVFHDYGWGLFLGIPFGLGFVAAILSGWHNSSTVRNGIIAAAISTALGLCLLFLFALEGILCIVMAVPIVFPIAFFGGVLGSLVQSNRGKSLCVLFIGTILLMGFEHLENPRPPTCAVISTIEVDASPQTVWENVVTFSDLPEVKDWLFKTGIAYPTHAEIKGQGVGAERSCVFSTGPFEEPITVWDEPRELRFGVTSQPAPMQEWTFYPHVHPPHLERSFRAEEGQFLLEPLPLGRTRLHGTTWYHNNLWPSSYWKLWSDFIIHRIHLRVLNHVKDISEQG
ncbi:MAG: hypothetical protein HOD72_13545 [Opitutae bacterium]|jgi:uncharacterized membrane protein YhaH (DUF805 family)|nr:hypothetical protein [Opitutae bacterium]MBT4225475.1 hypothetical protein [Opitutae bacterium]MBT5379638.1 hypothetical protein [Opitutae bacterium]MBT5689709.1 hypothetical protein [Opitutae bacterium]MBT6462015.1 hypothetical protein [Opitutae bacterium]